MKRMSLRLVHRNVRICLRELLPLLLGWGRIVDLVGRKCVLLVVGLRGTQVLG